MTKNNCLQFNNIYSNYPPLMSDSRYFTQHVGNQIMNDRMKLNQNIQSNFDYRMYLTHHGDEIIKHNQTRACNECGTCQYKPNTSSQNNTNKYMFKGITDAMTPYGYENSDLKKEYIDRQSLQSRTYTPLLTQSQLLKYMREK